MVPITGMCTRLTELVEDVTADIEKVLPKYGSLEVGSPMPGRATTPMRSKSSMAAVHYGSGILPINRPL